MTRLSRRAVLGSVTATALAGMGASAAGEQKTPRSGHKKSRRPVKPMTLEEFRNLKGPIPAEQLFNPSEGHTFMACHEDMREQHGIWIPELVPVFEKLDAMRASTV